MPTSYVINLPPRPTPPEGILYKYLLRYQHFKKMLPSGPSKSKGTVSREKYSWRFFILGVTSYFCVPLSISRLAGTSLRRCKRHFGMCHWVMLQYMLFARSFFSRSPHGHCIVPRLANTSPCCLQGLNLERLLSHAGAVARARWRDGYGLVQFAYYKYPNLKFCICLSS